jgi:hypothetical protein
VALRVLVAVAALSLSACGSSPTAPTRISPGTWGGDHIRLLVSDTSATIEFDCAHGSLNLPLVVDRSGYFDLAGIFVQEHGGPIRIDEDLLQEPARYTGTTDGRTMTMSVMRTTALQLVGTFSLAIGSPGRVVKCL